MYDPIPPITLLAAWPAEKQAAFIKSLPQVSFGQDEIIFMKDDPTTDVYFLLQGSVKAVNYDKDNGKTNYYRTRNAGDYFGYYSGICDQPRTATMIAECPVVCAKMSGAAFFRLVLETPAIGEPFIRHIMTLLRNETIRISNLTLLSASKRLVAELLFLREQSQSNTLKLPARNDFASYLNMTRETLARELSSLGQQGLISVRGTMVKIINPQALEGLLDLDIGHDRP